MRITLLFTALYLWAILVGIKLMVLLITPPTEGLSSLRIISDQIPERFISIKHPSTPFILFNNRVYKITDEYIEKANSRPSNTSSYTFTINNYVASSSPGLLIEHYITNDRLEIHFLYCIEDYPLRVTFYNNNNRYYDYWQKWLLNNNLSDSYTTFCLEELKKNQPTSLISSDYVSSHCSFLHSGRYNGEPDNINQVCVDEDSIWNEPLE